MRSSIDHDPDSDELQVSMTIGQMLVNRWLEGLTADAKRSLSAHDLDALRGIIDHAVVSVARKPVIEGEQGDPY